MKPRELHTVHDLIVTDYKVTPVDFGEFLHQFKPKTTDTWYQFTNSSSEPHLENGERYNIGFQLKDGVRIVDVNYLSKSTDILPEFSLKVAQKFSEEKSHVNKEKNDKRVAHQEAEGYYWGKKYAWREFGLVVSQEVFHKYLDHIDHPRTICLVSNPDKGFSNDQSYAYKEEGLKVAIEELILSAEQKSARYFTSSLYPKKFQIRGINSITDKK